MDPQFSWKSLTLFYAHYYFLSYGRHQFLWTTRSPLNLMTHRLAHSLQPRLTLSLHPCMLICFWCAFCCPLYLVNATVCLCRGEKGLRGNQQKRVGRADALQRLSKLHYMVDPCPIHFYSSTACLLKQGKQKPSLASLCSKVSSHSRPRLCVCATEGRLGRRSNQGKF